MAKKRVVRGRFYIFLASIVVLMAAVVLFVLLGSSGYEVVENGSLAYDKEAEVILVRDEQIVSQDSYGRISFEKLEGEAVSAGDMVATVYAWGYSEKVVQDLIDVQRQIEAYQEDVILGQVFENELQGLYTQINEKVAAVAEVVSGRGSADIVGIEREIKELMVRRNEYLKRTAVADEQLTALFERETELLDRVSAWKQDVTAEQAGTVSFFIDGFEEKLTPFNIDTLTEEQIQEVLSNYFVRSLAGTESSRPLYRLVKGERWYCLMVVPEDSKLMLDAVYSLEFAGDDATTHKGRLASIRKLGDNSLYTIEVSAPPGSLLSLRRADTKLSITYEGLKVSEKALHKQGETLGVWLTRKEGDVFTPIEIVFERDGYAIVRSVQEGALDAGMSVRQ